MHSTTEKTIGIHCIRVIKVPTTAPGRLVHLAVRHWGPVEVMPYVEVVLAKLADAGSACRRAGAPADGPVVAGAGCSWEALQVPAGPLPDVLLQLPGRLLHADTSCSGACTKASLGCHGCISIDLPLP